MVRKTNEEYGNKFVGLNVPKEFDKKVKVFLKEYNKKFRAETGRKMYKSEFFVMAAGKFIEAEEKKKGE